MKSNNEPLVSVIMNCYNGQKYLEESIESVLSQTYKNWELIFWDNQSADKSAEIFKLYKDKRLKYFLSKEHTTLYKARNLAIEKSSGDFIAFLDTDDLWHERKLEMQMGYFNNGKVGLVFSNFWLLKKNSKTKKLATKRKLPRGYMYKEILKEYNVAILTAMIRKSYYFKLEKKFDERFSFVGDFDLFLRLSKICIFESIQKPLAFYRLHGKNFSTLNKKKEVEELEMWLEENKSNLNSMQFQRIQKDIGQKKFLFAKIDGKYKESISILFNSKINLFSLKNLFLLFTPIALLKKFLWFYNDSN